MNEPRVLVIEDHDILRVMLFTILRNRQLAVDTAVSVDEALAKVRECDYALILIDLDVPGTASFFSSFSEERPGSTSFIIAVRTQTNELPRDDGRIAAVLDKPIEIDTLADVVRACAAVVPPPENPLQCPPAENQPASNERSMTN